MQPPPRWTVPALALALAASVSLLPLGQSSAGPPRLSGTVAAADERPLEGITMSWRAQGRTFVTSVFTDQNGRYLTPALEAGPVSLWAQGVGFEPARLDLQVTGGTQQVQPLVLRPLAADDRRLEKQLSGVEWLMSFPDATPDERREKQIFASNCTACHTASFTLQNRFDRAGWDVMVRTMAVSNSGTMPRDGWPSAREGMPSMLAYHEELVSFLTKVRGPGSPFTPRLLPRPTGDAARVVITEYDIPQPGIPQTWLTHDGSDWTNGTPSRHEGRGAHDVAVDAQGIVWIADDRSPDRTIARLDPKTGRVTSYVLPDDKGVAAGTHSALVDAEGGVWVTDRAEDILVKFDPKTETFQKFPRPPSIPGTGGTNAYDRQRNLQWATGRPENVGAIRLNPATGGYTAYRYRTQQVDNTYGVAVDRLGNPWFTSGASNIIGTVDVATGDVTEIVLPPLDLPDVAVTPKDRERYAQHTWGANDINAASSLHKCPRRLSSDPTGDYVWVALYCADRIAKIDIRTKAVTEIPMPRYTRPYGTVVDRNHMVWIWMMNTDMVAKLDPATERFTYYHLPTRGTDVRHLWVDDSTPQPTIWAAYNRVNKVARLEFR